MINRDSITKTIREQLEVGRYVGSDIYGDGSASGKIVSILKKHKPKIQKTISYVED